MPRTMTTLAIARDVPIGVVIVVYSNRLSRMFLWDVEKDHFEPGQLIKGRAGALDISAEEQRADDNAHLHPTPALFLRHCDIVAY